MKVTAELLEKYSLGLCSPEEKIAVEQWLDSSESELSFPSETDLPAHHNKIWAHVEQRIDGDNSGTEKILFLWRPWLVAACLIVAVGVSFFFFGRKSQEKLARQEQLARSDYQTIRTAKGEKRSLKLSDGTQVFLNADSEIRFSEKFTDTSRQVYLKGEAYFAVAKDQSRPFTVQTSTTKLTVLGTVFNLKAYSQHTTTLIVQEGKVQFSALSEDKEPLLFTANQRGIYNSDTGLKKDNVYAARHISWKDDHLVFDNESMRQVVLTLERWYDVDIQEIPQSLSKERFTGDFHDKPLEYVLERMSYVMEFKYAINNKTVRIY